MSYRPWGPFDWLHRKLGSQQWSVLGVSGTEDRCCSLLEALEPGHRAHVEMLRIEDPAPLDPAAYMARLDELAARLLAHGVAQEDFSRVPLLADVDTIRERIESFAAQAGPTVILDITAMPKWWFFPAVRFLLAQPGIETLVVTYASAENYGDDLSGHPRPLGPLPTFGGGLDGKGPQELIVGIGFVPLGLADLYSDAVERVRYLFPFPPGPPYFLRNWSFLRELQNGIEHANRQSDDRWHVHMYDCSSVFEALLRFTHEGARTSVLAPFGPKTVSLSMCLFALAAEAAGAEPIPVLYSQPQRYSLDYTSGIRRKDGRPEIHAYCLRLDGRDLYRIAPPPNPAGSSSDASTGAIATAAET